MLAKHHDLAIKPVPPSVSGRPTFLPASNAAATTAKNGTTTPIAARRRQLRALAVSRTARPASARKQAVGEHVAIVEHEREMCSAAAFSPPFSHNLRCARPASSELEVEDRWPMRNMRRVDHLEYDRESNCSYAGQDQRMLAFEAQELACSLGSVRGPVEVGSS
jgi:hypothetical protein